MMIGQETDGCNAFDFEVVLRILGQYFSGIWPSKPYHQYRSKFPGFMTPLREQDEKNAFLAEALVAVVRSSPMEIAATLR
jgi:hypothetical protein